MDLLDPFEVNHRDRADLYVGIAAGVDLAVLHRAVQAFVQQYVGIGGIGSHSVKVPDFFA